MRDDAVSNVIGAILVMGILGTSIVYVNAVHVPRQGAALEVAAGERAESSLLLLAADLTRVPPQEGYRDVPLRAERPVPPLLSGVILTPAQAAGSVALERGPNVTLSVLVDAPAGGVPTNDPMRVAEGGRMRVYLLGNATSGMPVGSLAARVGGAYVAPTEVRTEGGLVLSKQPASSLLVSPLAFTVARGANTSATLTLPLLAGAGGEVTGVSAAQVGLGPGVSSTLGGGLVHNATLRVDTSSVAAWREALQRAVGASGVVNVTLAGAPDNGTVSLDLQPPSGTAFGVKAVELRVTAVRYEVALVQRSS